MPECSFCGQDEESVYDPLGLCDPCLVTLAAAVVAVRDAETPGWDEALG